MQISDHRKIIEMLRLLQFHGIGRCGAAHGRAALSDDYAYAVGIIRHEESGVKLHIERIRSAVLCFENGLIAFKRIAVLAPVQAVFGFHLAARSHRCDGMTYSIVIKLHVKRHAFCAVIICVFIDYGYRRLGKNDIAVVIAEESSISARLADRVDGEDQIALTDGILPYY